MATSFQCHVHHSFEPPADSFVYGGRKVPGLSSTRENSSFTSTSSTMGTLSGFGAGAPSTALTDLVHTIRPQNTNGMFMLGTMAANHESLLEWIRSERMHKLPPEGSSYDKVLICAKLFVERLNSFDGAIQHFAQESQTATQLAYMYCASLLEFGEENADALLDLFNFFYRCSIALDNLLSRAELFTVSQTIKDQVILALADLVTLVFGIATHFRKRLGESRSVTIDIYSTFPGPIESFRTRCENVSELMWKHQLLQEGTEIKTLRQWLEPEDRVLSDITKFTAQFAQEREESTCLWLNPYITRFLKSDQNTLAIVGKPGSGKSILGTVINDQLQHPIGGVSYRPLFVPINSRIPALTTPAAVAKGILRQLFASRIGNISLYRTLSDAYARCSQTVDEDQFVNVLWNAIKTALPACLHGARESVLVVDGLDEASCGQSSLVQRLVSATANAGNLKMILLASEKPAGVAEQSVVQITPDQIFDDISAVVRRVFKSSSVFDGVPSEEREICLNRILASKKIRDEGPSGAQALAKSIDNLVKAKNTVNDLVAHVLKSNVHPDGKKIMGWLAIASRPLATWELSSLLSVQVDKGTISESKTNPLETLKPLAPLVFCQNNLVYLRHGRIRTALLEALSRGESKPAARDTHIDFLQRLSLYLKQTVTGKGDPSLDPIDPQHTSTLLGRYPLLEFAIRYWLGHTRALFDCDTDKGIASAGKELRPHLPTSPMVARLEMTLWSDKSTPVLALVHRTQTQLYQQVLGSKHLATLQTILCQALFYQKIQPAQPTQTSQILYDAAVACQHVLSTQHLITMHMTQLFLSATSSQVTTTHTEIMQRRVEILRVLVECYKVHYGSTSDVVISTLHQLVRHYTAIGETHEADKLTTFLQGVSTDKGPEYLPDRRPSEDSLIVQLHGPMDAITHGTVLVLDDVEQDQLISTSFDFDALITLAEKYVHESNASAAESTYVDLWHKVSKAYRVHRSIEWELRSLQVVQAYSNLLLTHGRESEVAALLSSFWTEHQEVVFSDEEIATQYVAVAQLMKTVKLSWLALEVLKQSSQQVSVHSSLHQQIQEHIQSTFNEIKHTAGSHTTTITESDLIEMIYEESVDSSFTAAATQSIVQGYLSQHRWKDATKSLKRILRAVWPSFFALSTDDVRLPSKDVQYCIKLAQQLRDCYTYRRHTMKEEDVCLRVYRALRRDRPAGDKTLHSATQRLIQLYERTRETDKLVSIHIDILNDYSNRFGRDHPVVLQQLWTLAELTRLQPASINYYRQIFEILNKDSDTCEPQAFDALVILVTELTKQAQYPEALRPCQILFNTLQHPRINNKLRDPEFVRSVYERYALCLQATHADAHVIHDVTVQYRKTCLTVFGAQAAITIHATQTLAFIAQGFKQYEGEAIELFQTLLDMHSNEVDIDYEAIRITLEAIYEGQQGVSQSWAELSSTQFHRVVTARIERLSTFRETYGWAHESSISQMEEVVSMYEQRKETQAALTLLQETAVHIASAEQVTTEQITAATRIASSYRRLGQIHRAKKLALEIYQQIVAQETTSAAFTLSSAQRHSLLFLAQLEYSLREREEASLTMAEIHSSLVAESQYFERFRKEIRSTSSTLQSVLGIAAHLHGLLLARGQTTMSAHIVEQFADYFMSTHGRKLDLQRSQATIFVSTILDYFQSHSSQNFLRSIALASHNRVVQLLQSKDHDRHRLVCDLALATFRYIRAVDGLSSIATVQSLFKTGLAISRWAMKMRRAPESEKLLQVSAVITKDILGYCKTKDIDLTHLDALNLSTLIKLLDNEKDYQSLTWILSALWEKRQKLRATRPNDTYTLSLGRRLAITLYMAGDRSSAIRLAEDIVYNCARVHGARHTSTLEMTVLLSQMYTSVAQGYQGTADHRELATQYYKRAAALHENALRAFVDPSSAPTAIDADTELASSPSSSEASSPGGEDDHASGKSVRQHLHLLKLAVERLGNWPKDYSEYERLNSDVFRMFQGDLDGIKGLDKCNLRQFGAGRAEASDDLLSPSSIPQMDLNQFAIAV
ncbi:NACHT domain protein [Aspergillus pseudoustus]|uniref:NACHT domain protein n=1 Tax=Aspergillus pseudoustus TaxID=1810923 RepID=A0ABR4JTF6_9EURO